ncbi:MAG: hypothetical protein GX974_02390 [Clostridiales bacterium]|nr:hypothetical protein [Clostridiales bacterium]
MGFLIPLLFSILMFLFAKGIEQARGTMEAERRQEDRPRYSRGRGTGDAKVRKANKNTFSPSSSTFEKESPPIVGLSKVDSSEPGHNADIHITKKSVLNGIIMAEILSPPKSKRR